MRNRKATGEGMRRSWLVQRLKAPNKRFGLLGTDNPCAFGGGYKNGGLSDEAMGLLRGIFSFDYMGAAEFEFGALPDALRRMAKSVDDLIAFGHEVDGGTVFVLCPSGWKQEVCSRIEGWASPEPDGLKEWTNLHGALNPQDEWDGRVVGWLELDNGFFFSIDRKMWEGFCRLLGVSVKDIA